jgi:phosphohistidine phosphatase
MYVYLIQHAKAKPEEEDPERGITDEGAAEARECFAFLARQRPAVDEIWHSGKKRAGQTAEILNEALGSVEVVAEHPGLAPNDEVQSTAEELKSSDKSTAVVGHMPHLAKLASYLLAGDETREVIRFRNAGVVCLEREGSSWRVCWMVTPELELQ